MNTRQQFITLAELGISSYSGEVLSAFDNLHGKEWLATLTSTLAKLDDQHLLYKQRNRVYRIADPTGPGELCVKVFKKPDRLRSLIYRQQGSKAQRAHQFAKHLFAQHAAVTEPVGFIEQWQGSQLVESVLISRFYPNATDLYSEMTYLLRDHPYAGAFVNLIRVTAQAVRKMHDSGFLHGDLGPQNILLTRTGDASWTSPVFIDLNRGQLCSSPTLRQRARDLERMKIPTHFLRIFHHIYFNDGAVPAEFLRWDEHYRARFRLHQRSRKYRHPIRTLKNIWSPKVDNRKHTSTGQPAPRDVWLWDEFSAQPSVMHRKKERARERKLSDLWVTIAATLQVAPSVYKHYQERKASVYQQPIDMRQRLGISLEVDESFALQRKALVELPASNILVRCYYHLGTSHIAACHGAIGALKADGHKVSLALIQSRDAVIHPERWFDFVDQALERLHEYLDCVEVGHAVNRVKWGFWNLEEITRLWPTDGRWKARYPHLTFIGPAVNDFEFQYYPPLLARAGQQFDALSGHLYVDRRGAPETAQNGFSSLEKGLLAKALADQAGKHDFYVTEVNWPLKNTGLYSPVAGAYQVKDSKESNLHVSDELSAAYMVRYALITLCSGAVSGIWWWRLAHPGFGLIDTAQGWRLRPGWHAFATFQRNLANTTFVQKHQQGEIQWWDFVDTDTGQPTVSIAYALQSTPLQIPREFFSGCDLYGRALSFDTDRTLLVNEYPTYFFRQMQP